jgi:alginate O-acetyltransferase complex protein AlgI
MVVEGLNLVLPRASALGVPSFVLPLGISFFTFECVSYLLDVRKGSKELVPLHRFLLFPAFFPHMIAGPILRIREFGPQLEKPHTASTAEVLAGVDRIVLGFLKKLVIADTLGAFVDSGFGSSVAPGAVDGWVLSIAFSFQIYFDFSAYSDIAIGSARALGFNFPENFNLPYHAKNPSEFWNRWHMTLSRWIRDYLFLPVLMKQGRPKWFPLAYTVLVMSLMGLWHGAGLTFVCWGAWHGLLMVGHRLVQGPVAKRSKTAQRYLDGLGRVVTLLLIFAGSTFFRSRSLGQALGILGSMFTLNGLRPAYSPNDYGFLLGSIFVYLLLEPRLLRWFARKPEEAGVDGWRFWLRAPLYALAVQFVFMFEHTNVGFIYFQF